MSTGGATFLRHDVDFLDLPPARAILAGKNGDGVVVFFWQLAALAGRANLEDGGVVIGAATATAETLAAVTGRRGAFVRDALDVLATAGLIEREGDNIRIADWGRYLQPDTAAEIREGDRLRQAARRARLKSADGETLSPPSAETRGIPADGGDPAKVAILDALIATGKFKSLLYEHVALVMREHPRAELEKNFAEIVSEAKSVSYNVITNALAWLRRSVSGMELRKTGGTGPRGYGRKAAVAPPLPAGSTWGAEQ